MQPYANLSGNSGVSAFEIGEGEITIEFKYGGKYLYTNSSTGREKIEAMHQLATKGSGLAAFISQNVKKDFEKKF